jgi:hypothetical protein
MNARGYTGANPTIASYNASVDNVKGSLARLENKNIFFYLLWKML